MEYTKITAGRAAEIPAGANVNFGDGVVLKIIRFEPSPYRDNSLNSEYAVMEREDGSLDRYARNVLRGGVESDDNTIRRCQYCGKIRPGNEMVVERIYRNHGGHNETFCADDNCAQCAQMSAEG